MSNQNIFSALAKYNSASDENYLTEAFVFVINSLVKQNPSIGCGILNRLCVNNNEFAFNIDEGISVLTQEGTEEGTPDIKISCPDKLIYVEVKHDSPPGHRQVSRYKKALESSTATIKHVVLLTRFAVDYENQEEMPYKHVRWFEVYNWLDSAQKEVKDPISVYLIDEFKSFLEVKQMSMQKVGWEYINGVTALNNLINMIEVAIKNSQIQFYPVYPRSAGWEFKGFILEDKEFWCGIHYNNPSVITFELQDKKRFDRNKIETTSYELREGKERLWFRLPLEVVHFFSLDKDEQLEAITNFVKIAYAEAQKMRI